LVSVANIIEESKLGGPQVRIATVAHALKDDIDTTVIMPEDNSGDFCLLCDSLSVKYRKFWISRITKEWKVAIRYALFFLYEVFQLVIFFKREKFEIIHVSGGSWQYKGLIAGKLSGKKVLWHLNDTQMPKLFKNLFMLFGRYADGYIFASECSQSYYNKLVSADKLSFIIPAPVNLNKFDPYKKYNGDEILVNNFHGKIVIGIVANLNPIKGLETFIKAANLLNRNYEALIFVVIGKEYVSQKKYISQLKLLCKKLSVANIWFVGGRSDIRPLLSRFDIYVCSSIAESSPISVWEALAMEKPIVSTNVGDVPLYVRKGINGFIVDVGDVVAMHSCLKTLIDSRYLRQKYGYNSRQIAIKELDISLCAQKHLDAYNKVLNI